VPNLQEFREKEFNELIKSKGNAVIEFGAPWCAACKLTEPIICEAQKKYPEISFAKIDVGKMPGIASRMGVMSLPNILVIKNGKVADQVIGTTTKKILEEKIKIFK
jgi:thioredoxin 1